MQGFNMGRYIPPDLEGLTTPNALHKKHPLGARARHPGSLTVRFEMPFAIWCTTCKPHETIIGQGVRFNAEKKKVGNYYSTPVYSFRMKHGACGGWIEIRTDPKNTEYVVTEGARRRDTGVGKEGVGEGGEIVIRDGLAGFAEAGSDPFAKLEGKVEDKKRGESERDRILKLQERQARDWEDPYEKSRRLRRAFRVERKGLERREDGKRMKTADLVAERKAMFRSELTGNTRAVVDPFLSSDGSAWRPEVKRRKLVASGVNRARRRMLVNPRLRMARSRKSRLLERSYRHHVRWLGWWTMRPIQSECLGR
ncbi:DUF572-domain-containing protein [Aspergillus sclerotioniger CBS 115572]|uniref:DUF572-domain-containing protein n=1 Tax=Aspergillus sclerotioniger CBS 115572 TaxID=1450535 RepID=A0A317WAZ6_9EURO|nr:DUF572-domain-containing protein [Aspergillus sclerotioniger CBS 115572]PWY83676.1 DUF572-domain-containing protein [Aspergillus sclerotioniger CBS 115572]